MEIIDWASGVNRIIESSSFVSIGNNAVQSDKSENGTEQTRLLNLAAPDIWTVSMTFSNSNEDSFYLNHGITEWQSFIKWFKFNTLYGTKPFHFASIDDPTGKEHAVYKITPSGFPKGVFQGTVVKCSMQWKRIYNSFVTFNTPAAITDDIDVTNGQIDVRFVSEPDSDPSIDDFTVLYGLFDKTVLQQLVIDGIDYDGSKSVILYFQEIADPGTYKIQVTYKKNVLSRYLIVGE